MTIRKLLVVCSTLDLDYPFGTTPAWWQFFKSLYEEGVELVVVPYLGRSIRSLWWRCYKNPCYLEGSLYDILNSKLRNSAVISVTSGGKKERYIPKIAQAIVRPKWRKHLYNILEREKDVEAVVFLQVPLNHLKGVPSRIKKDYDLPFICYDGDMPIALPSYGGFTFNYYVGADLTEYDMFFVNSEGVIDDLRNMGAEKVYALHYAADPDVFSPVDIDKDIDVFFHGLGGRFREKWIHDFVAYPSESLPQLRFVVAGKWFRPDLGNARNAGMVPFNAWRQLCSRSKINLNITRETHSKVPATSSSRPFELASLGCCVISNPYNGLEKWFKVGEEMFVAADSKEAIELYQWLISADDQREKIGERARQRVLKEHTYRHRAKRFLSLIEGC